jgi:hypothetical protein
LCDACCRATLAAVTKYSALRDHLAQSGRELVTLSFETISNLVDGGLPDSAYRHRPWWANEAEGRHVQSVSGWIAAGYVVDHVDQVARRVTFRRES